jgi:hypothetical protein
MRKHLSKWHRRFGIFAAFIAIYLSFTGLLLNHSQDLGLNHTPVRIPLLLKLYGIKAPEGLRAVINQHVVDKIGNTLFIDGKTLGQHDAPLISAVAFSERIYIALADSILILTEDAELVEALTLSNGLPGTIHKLTISNTASTDPKNSSLTPFKSSDQKLLILTSKGLFQSNADLLEWARLESTIEPRWASSQTTPDNAIKKLQGKLPDYGPSWERFLQDLHSGRFFKLPGTLIVDLAAVLLLLLSFSGIISFSISSKARRKKNK